MSAPHDPLDRAVATPGSGLLKIESGKPTIVIDGSDAESGDHVTKITAPNMTTRSSQRSDGSASIEVQGADEIGQAGEGRLAKTLMFRLREYGVTVTVDPGKNDRGEDAILCFGNGDTRVLQVTTGFQATDFWGAASRSSGATTMSLEQMGQHLEKAIQAKNRVTPRDGRSRIVLALDARHTPPLASQVVVHEYLRSFGDPATRDGWSSVWVIGPTTQTSHRIGSGLPY